MMTVEEKASVALVASPARHRCSWQPVPYLKHPCEVMNHCLNSPSTLSTATHGVYKRRAKMAGTRSINKGHRHRITVE